MQSGISLSELAETLEREAKERRDFIVPSRDLTLTPEGKLEFTVNDESESFSVTDHTHRQIGQKTGIPAQYYDRLRSEHPDLLSQNVNRWFSTSDDKRMVRTNGRGARALLSDGYRTLDNFEIAITALRAVRETSADLGLIVRSANVTESHLYIQAETPRVTAEVKKGDVVSAGFALRNSEIGLGAASVQRLVMRKVCDNGLIVPDGKYTARHLGRRQEVGEITYREDTLQSEQHTFLLQLRDHIVDAVDQTKLIGFAERAGLASERQITGDPVKAVAAVAEMINSGVEEQAAILRSLISGGDLSAWGVVNAVTAQAHSGSYDRAVELEAAGGQLLDLPQSEWKRVLEAA